jgi:hypothetical protein
MGYEAQLQKAVQLSRTQHTLNTILKKHGEARLSNQLTQEVCKTFFMSTVCIWDKLIRYTLQRKQHGVFVGIYNRGKHAPANKTNDVQSEYIKKHIECFPVVESQYTRKSTKRRYLSQDLSIRKIYDLYKIKFQEDEISPASEMVYRKIFCTEYNLSFHKPKKDLCQICNKYNEKTKTNTVTEEDKFTHSTEGKCNDRKRARQTISKVKKISLCCKI